MTTKKLRCAIYTRKSSEDGLEQSFNSLDAQREACEAYILSQANEGWTALADRYDDGGYSGGNMDRPGLRHLLGDIEADRIDIIIVYKIDRLTRSLADFARIVEIFETAECSFVSVTQAFNTTGSMGKLMLNVLLSFAQFEREVTGERIRDKIAASKAKGMWMGGTLPLGYDLPADDRRILRVNREEAETVRHIFSRYLELGSVHALQRELSERAILSKRRVTKKGKSIGGKQFSRGALFHLLRNRIYCGEIVHKGKAHDGGHKAIVDSGLFQRVQDCLNANRRRCQVKAKTRQSQAPLTGKLFDANGEPMSPTRSRGKSGRSYRYYVSASLQQGARPASSQPIVQRIPALEIERVVTEAVRRWLPRINDALVAVRAVHLALSDLQISIDTARDDGIASRLADDERFVDRGNDYAIILAPVHLPLRGGVRKIERTGPEIQIPDPTLIGALRKAHAMLNTDHGMPIMNAAPASPYDRFLLNLAFLAPDIQRAILEGRQPRHLNLEAMKAIHIPLAWTTQRKVLGFEDCTAPCYGDYQA